MKRFSIRALLILTAVCAVVTLGLVALSPRVDDSAFVNSCLDLEADQLTDVAQFAASNDRRIMPMLLQLNGATYFQGISLVALDGRRVEFRICDSMDLTNPYNPGAGWSEYQSAPVIDVNSSGNQNTISDAATLVLDGG